MSTRTANLPQTDRSRRLSRTAIIAIALATGCGGTSSTALRSTGAEYVETTPSYEGDSADEGRPSTSGYGGDSVAAAPSAPVAQAGAVAHTEGAAPSVPPRSVASTRTDSVVPAASPMAESVSATVSTTTTVTVTVDTPTLPGLSIEEPVQQARRASILTAASVGDHDRRGNYLEYLSRHPYDAQSTQLDMGRRMRLRVVDAQGGPVHDADVQVQVGNQVVQGKTHADGSWDFFPGAYGRGLSGAASISVQALGTAVRAQAHVPSQGDGQDVEIRLANVQTQRARQVLDLAFLIDVTGSMEDELRYVNDEVVDIVARVRRSHPETQVRVGAVFYRDRTDSVPLQRIQFTDDVQAFANAMHSVRAQGGGDYPEDLDSGLATAFSGMQWSQGQAVRVLCVIADAPPQNYQVQFGYREAMREASRLGIRLLPVAASGSDRRVEFLFRAMATMTSTPYVYLTDDSGVGAPHMEADTDRVAVEYFSELLTRLVVSDLAGRGMHEPAGFDR